MKPLGCLGSEKLFDNFRSVNRGGVIARAFQMPHGDAAAFLSKGQAAYAGTSPAAFPFLFGRDPLCRNAFHCFITWITLPAFLREFVQIQTTNLSLSATHSAENPPIGSSFLLYFSYRIHHSDPCIQVSDAIASVVETREVS